MCSYIHIILYYHLSVDAFLRILSTYFKDSVVISVFSTILERAVKENLLSLSPSGKIRSVENQFLLPNYTLSQRSSYFYSYVIYPDFLPSLRRSWFTQDERTGKVISNQFLTHFHTHPYIIMLVNFVLTFIQFSI